MNKFLTFGLIAGAGVLMAGCAKDAANSEFGQNAIEFGTYLGRDAHTKGIATTTDNLTSFGVTAFYTGQNAWTAASADAAPNFMYNQEVKKSGDSWSYSPVKYWPTMKGDRISFFAYAPYAPTNKTNGIELEDNTTTNTPSLTFRVADKASDMVDFVAAQVIDATQKDDAKGGQGAVAFNLKHELSRLAFKVNTSEGMAEKSHVVLRKVELVAGEGFYKSATYTFANVTNQTGVWSMRSEMDNSYNIVDVLSDDFKAQAIGGKAYTDNVLDLTSATAVDLFKTGGYLFLIPSAEGLAANKTAVTFYYDIVTEDSNLNVGYSCTEATKTVYLPEGLLKQGKAYNVTFTFNVDQIEVAASVAGWDEPATSSEVEVPFTPDDATK